MCHLCQTKPVYEFTNKRKLCKTCFIRWFEKKVLYTIRKFQMIKKNEVVCYKKSNDFRGVVLESVLKMFCERAGNELRSLRSHINSSDLTLSKSSLKEDKLKGEKSFQCCTTDHNDVKNNLVIKNKNFTDNKFLSGKSTRAVDLKRTPIRAKLAISDTSDIIAKNIIHEIIKDKLDMKKHGPVVGKVIKPLYLFLDKEILLYAKLKKLNFVKKKVREDKIDKFVLEMEKKHPEVKHAVVRSYLELCG